jgi:hypothetical protein
MGMTTGGVYTDEFLAVEPETLQEFLSCHGKEHKHLDAFTGAGHPPDEDKGIDSDVEWAEDEDLEGIEQHLASDIQANVCHPTVKVPQHENPFTVEQLTLFNEYLPQFQTQNSLLHGYGVQVEEWGIAYPALEHIKGKLWGKVITVSLPVEIWLP